MKNLLLTLILCATAISFANGQSLPGAKYLGIGYSKQKLSSSTGSVEDFSNKSTFGANFFSGRTFFLNKKPVAKVLYFGIDWTYLDLNYSQHKIVEEYTTTDEETGATTFESETLQVHKAEAGMQVGPSIHVGLKDGFTISGHVRYAPSYSMLYLEDEFGGGFGNFYTAGVSINYGFIGVGFESRGGSAKHSFNFNIDDFEEQEEQQDTPSQKIKLSGSRVYLAFRF